MDEGALDALGSPRRCYHHFLLGLAIMPRLRKLDALDSLRVYHRALLKQREGTLANLERQKPLPYFVEAMFDYSLTLVCAEIDWVEKFILRLQTMESDAIDNMEVNNDED